MKIEFFLLPPLLLVVVGCTSMFQPKNMSDSDYRKLYYDYRTLVTKAIKNNNEANLEQITDEYISKRGNIFFSITVDHLTPSGKWKRLLYKRTSLEIRKMAMINWGTTDKVNIYRGEGYVLLESNEIRQRSTYKDNIHIRMEIK